MTDTPAQSVLPAAAPAPAPAGAGWWSSVRRASAGFWLRFMFWWADHFPPMVLWTRPFFLWGAWRFSKSLRRGTLLNARRLLGPQATERECTAFGKRVITSFYLSVYEIGACCRLTSDQLRRRVDAVDGTEAYDSARREKKGAILVTAHLGSFELGVAALMERECRLHVVFRRDEIPRFDRIRSRLRGRLGVVEVPVDQGWSIWVHLRDALLADEVVIIQGDRLMPGQRGVAVPFLSGHIRLPTGPIKLAQATGAPIIPVFSIRTALHRVRIVIDEPIYVDAAGTKGGPDEVHPALRQLASAIERQVVAHPDQWLMVEPAWCEDADADI